MDGTRIRRRPVDPRPIAVVVCVLALMSCTGGSGGSGSEEPDAAAPAVPTSTRVSASSERPGVDVSIDPVDGADGYLLKFDDRDDPIRLEAEQCSGGTCRLGIGREALAGSTRLRVASIRGKQRSEYAAPVSFSVPAPQERKPERPTEAVVVSDGEDGPEIRTHPLKPGRPIAAQLEELAKGDDVVAVDVNRPMYTDGVHAYAAPASSQPDGDVTWQQEALDFSQLPAEPRGRGVTVAVIDDRVETSHPSLRGADITVEVVDDEAAERADPFHGTVVTSLIAGQPEGDVPGVATGVRIRNYVTAGELTTANVARAIDKAVLDGVDVISISLSANCGVILGYHVACPPADLDAAVRSAERRGIVVVASVGNVGPGCDDPDEDPWPAKFDTVIGVGASTRSGERWPCTRDEDYVDVLAPGDGLRVADPRDPSGYSVQSGTSLATPLVAGVIAAVLNERPDLTPAEVRDALRSSVGAYDRLVPAALLQHLGLVDDEIPIDLTTGAQVVPFESTISFDEDHPVSKSVDAYWDAVLAAYAGTGDGNIRSTINVNGVLFFEENGQIQGVGALTPTTRASTGAYSETFSLRCPAPPSTGIILPDLPLGDPYEREFGWRLRGPVAGSIEQARGDGADGRLDLTFTLGAGAEADETGSLPGFTVSSDDLEGKCPEALKMYEGPEGLFFEEYNFPTWEESQAERDAIEHALERFHAELVEAGPYELSLRLPEFQDEIHELSDYALPRPIARDGMEFKLSLNSN